MAWLLFIDESGHDGAPPYEVLAGVAVEDRQLWPLIKQLNDSQQHHFGVRWFGRCGEEAKARKLLKKKTFRLAQQKPTIPRSKRSELAKAALEDGANVAGDQLIALCQAKIAYCQHALTLCRNYGCVAFASVVPNDIERPIGNFLRKDYSFMFERFHHFLDNKNKLRPMGIIVFYEKEKIQSHVLLSQMAEYFISTRMGQSRADLIIPEPLFVHSDLTSMVQMADLAAYIISWGVRLPGMSKPRREELHDLGGQVLELRYHHRNPTSYDKWGFKVIKSLSSKGPRSKGR